MNNIPENVLAVHPDAIEVILLEQGYVSIYVLLDPRTDKVRYVGEAINPAARMGAHLSFPKWEDTTLKQKWLKELVSLDLRPRMIVIETVSNTQVITRERFWILFYRERGEADCNWQSTASEEKYQKSKQNNIATKKRAAEREALRQKEMKR